MSERTAIVIDTNFIIERQRDLQDIHRKLSETYDVFVSDVSIQERLSQKYLELHAKYDKIEKFSEEYTSLVKIEIKQPFETQFESRKERVQNDYRKTFGDNIIPFVSDEDMLKTIMNRVFKKIPPFVDGSSDKGFKDTMIWLSLLEYFKSHESDNVIFITGDKGFRNNIDALCREFNEYTGKTIEIQGNNFYDNYIKGSEKCGEKAKENITPLVKFSDFAVAREQIRDTIKSLCLVEHENNWGETWHEKAFTLSTEITIDDVKILFEGLREVMAANLFETTLLSSIAFPAISAINKDYHISTSELQAALALYEDIRNIHPEYMPQFFSAVANIFNENYVAPKFEDFAVIDDDGDLPF